MTTSPRAAATPAPRLVLREVRAGVRPVRLRLPFRFGAVTLEACPQLFVEAAVEVEGRGRATGQAAEMMVPRWFDKRSDRTPADNVGDLAASLQRAVEAYVDDAPATPFDLHARHDAALMSAGDGATALSRAYGAAVLDRAILDAACRALGLSFAEALRANALGLRHDRALAPDLAGFDWSAFLASLQPRVRIAVRHTVGMLDPLDGPALADDGLPRSLPGAIAANGLTRFKVKLGGDPDADARRLGDVLAVLDREAPGHRYTLDGNEQYASRDALVAFGRRLRELPAWQRRPDALDYVEQPIARDASLSWPMADVGLPAPLLLDEGDAGFDAFPRAAALGWHGVSSKTCKGLYKAVVNAARCARWNDDARRSGRAAGFFLSGEDLTCQAGLSVQQDLALVAALGLTHVERNGHHYGGGFGDAPAAEVQTFEQAHPTLYARADGGNAGGTAPLRLAIRAGDLDLRSLAQPGYARVARVDLDATRPLGDAVLLTQVVEPAAASLSPAA